MKQEAGKAQFSYENGKHSITSHAILLPKSIKYSYQNLLNLPEAKEDKC